MGQKIDFKKLAKISAQLLKGKKGKDIVVLDVGKVSDFTDYLVVASGTSDTHIRTLYSEVEEKLPILPCKKEIKNKTKWAVLDYGGFIVHIFHADSRKFYNLESNWGLAEKIVSRKVHGKKSQKTHRKNKKQ
ncbi:MAG: ribosome silencing factor [Elusimicrobiota bacterium]